MLDKLKTHLKNHGASVTPGRLTLFKYLRAHDRAAIHDVIAAHPQFDQASIYRTLALFKELGVVQDVIAGGRKLIELTDSFDSHHHHLSCTQCGLSITIEDPAIEKRLHQLALHNGITPLTHQIEVSGLCESCKKHNKPSTK